MYFLLLVATTTGTAIYKIRAIYRSSTRTLLLVVAVRVSNWLSSSGFLPSFLPSDVSTSSSLWPSCLNYVRYSTTSIGEEREMWSGFNILRAGEKGEWAREREKRRSSAERKYSFQCHMKMGLWRTPAVVAAAAAPSLLRPREHVRTDWYKWGSSMSDVVHILSTSRTKWRSVSIWKSRTFLSLPISR